MTPLQLFFVSFLAGFGIGLGMAFASRLLPVRNRIAITYDNLDKK